MSRPSVGSSPPAARQPPGALAAGRRRRAASRGRRASSRRTYARRRRPEAWLAVVRHAAGMARSGDRAARPPRGGRDAPGVGDAAVGSRRPLRSLPPATIPRCSARATTGSAAGAPLPAPPTPPRRGRSAPLGQAPAHCERDDWARHRSPGSDGDFGVFALVGPRFRRADRRARRSSSSARCRGRSSWTARPGRASCGATHGLCSRPTLVQYWRSFERPRRSASRRSRGRARSPVGATFDRRVRAVRRSPGSARIDYRRPRRPVTKRYAACRAVGLARRRRPRADRRRAQRPPSGSARRRRPRTGAGYERRRAAGGRPAAQASSGFSGSSSPRASAAPPARPGRGSGRGASRPARSAGAGAPGSSAASRRRRPSGRRPPPRSCRRAARRTPRFSIVSRLSRISEIVVERLAMLAEDVLRALVRGLDDAADLVVDLARDLVGVVGLGGELAAQERLAVVVAEHARAELARSCRSA